MSTSPLRSLRPRPSGPRAVRLGRGRRAVLLLLAWGGGAWAEEPAEWERDAPPEVFYVSPVDAKGRPTHVVFRAVDDVTGEPLPGATATLRAESPTPRTGLVPAIRTGAADAQGWIRIRADDLGWEPTWIGPIQVYVEAPGQAGATYTKGTGGEARLARARDVVVEVRDALDRPVAGATVGVHDRGICLHMPDQRAAVTDAEGVAVLPALGLPGGDADSEGWEAWVEGDGLLGDDHEIEVRLFPAPRQILRHRPAPPVEGTILDAEGRPVAGAHVGTLSRHRGPWTGTEAAGRFRLLGARSFDDLVVVMPNAPGGAAPTPIPGVAPPPGVHRVFRGPRPGTTEAAEPEIPVAISVLDPSTGKDLAGEPPLLWAVRASDGRTEVGRIQRLPAGTWTLGMGGGASPWLRRTVRVVVDGEPGPTVALEAMRAPAFAVAWSDEGRIAHVALVTATDERELAPEELASGRIHLGAESDAVFRITSTAREAPDVPFHVEFVRIPRGLPSIAPPLALRPTLPRRLRARCETPAGEPAPAWLTTDLEFWLGAGDLRPWDADLAARPDPEVEVLARGPVDVLVVPQDRSLAPRVVTVSVPDEPTHGRDVDLGVVRFAPRGEPRLVVVRSDGTPLAWTSLRVIRGGVVRRAEGGETNGLDPFPFTLAEGDVVEVEAPWHDDETVLWARPVRHRLEGPGPWTVRGDLPATSIVLDPPEAYEDLVLVVDGKAYEARPGTDAAGRPLPLEVAGLSPGPHEVAVAAANRRTRLYRLVLVPGERRRLAARLASMPGHGIR